jgi:hypothetical protein
MMPPVERSFAHPFWHLADVVKRNPAGIAISTIGTELTFFEADDTVLRIARAVRDAEIRPGFSGFAKIAGRRLPLAFILTFRAVHFLRIHFLL